MNRLKVLYRGVAEIGVQETLSFEQSNRIALSNIFCAVTILLFLCDIAVSWFRGHSENIAVSSIFALSLLPIFYLNHRHAYLLARVLLLLLLTGHLVGLTVWYGQNFGTTSAFLMLTLVSVYLFQKWNHQLVLSSIILISCLASHLFVQRVGPVSPLAENDPVALINFAISAFVIMVLARQLMSENMRYLRLTNTLLDEGQAKNEELSRQNLHIQKVNQELERFAHITSHDLKAPIRAIASFSGLVRESLQRNDIGRAQKHLNYVEKGAKQLHSIVDDILQYSKLGDSAGEKEAVDLNDLVQELREILQPDQDTRHIVCTPLPTIRVVRSEFRLLLQNLIDNALKYNQSELPQVQISAQVTSNSLNLLIVDNGIGIDVSYQDEIFTQFTRLHSSDDYEGTGIGLAICKKIVEKLGGSIGVQSEVGNGSIFKISLPKSVLKNRPSQGKNSPLMISGQKRA